MCAICKIAQRYQKHRAGSMLPTVEQLTRTVILTAANPPSEIADDQVSAPEKQP